MLTLILIAPVFMLSFFRPLPEVVNEGRILKKIQTLTIILAGIFFLVPDCGQDLREN